MSALKKQIIIEVKAIKEGGALKDLSPTMLDLLNIEKPKAMTGISLIIK